MRIRRHSILPIVTFAFVAAATFSFFAAKDIDTTSAVSAANFMPGNIISDYVMGNYNSMTEAEIQAFLSSHGNCNFAEVWRASAGNNDPSSFHVKDGHFVCLADETFGEGIAYGDVAPNGQTAAHIIWQAAQDFRINPQVLIVLLEKEQGLITDAWPNRFQYRSATGYGCPDTAACNTKYYGFENQVRNAAWMFRSVLDGGWTNYPLGENYIQYNPDPGCGGSVVNVENLATSALYRYTPYQPNAGALAAGFGTAYCGAYGNRNFYLYFANWFGNPTGYSASKEITDVYDSFGGPNGELGPAVASEQSNQTTDMHWQEYKNGFIVGNKEHGYHISIGSIRGVWKANGFESGPLGFPITNIESNKATGIEWQEFENGFIVGNYQYGYHISMGPIRSIWKENNFESGILGFPITDILSNNNTGIKWQEFSNGFVVGNDEKGYYLSVGDIRQAWRASGFESGPLGFPQSNLITEGDRTYQKYDNGWIILDGQDCFTVSGEIYKKWTEYQNFDGELGWPIDHSSSNIYTNFYWQEFEHGFVVGNDQYGYHISIGDIRSVWRSYGFEGGILGYPITEILTNEKTGIYWQEFSKGFVVGNTTHGYYISMGPIRNVWRNSGFESGVLGFPVTNILSNNNTGIKWQEFENGFVVGNDRFGYYISMGPIRDFWKETGFEWGKFGFPISNPIQDSDTIYQKYERGIIYHDNSSGHTWSNV